MTGTTKPSTIELVDLYRGALQTCADIERTLAERGVVPAERKRDTEYSRERLLFEKGFPHDCLNLNGMVNERNAARSRADTLDGEIGKEIKTVLKGPSVHRAANDGNFKKLITGLVSRFTDNAEPESVQALLLRREDMYHVLRVLKTAQTGVGPLETGKSYGHGYLTPRIDRLVLGQHPKSHEDWRNVADKTLAAMNPKIIDECVIDYKFKDGQDTHIGVRMMMWGGNTDSGVSANPQWSMQLQKHYGRQMVHFGSEQGAQEAFSSIITAKTAEDVRAVLGERASDYGDMPVKIRHTLAGNFLGGNFGSDQHHPNSGVRAAHFAKTL